MSKKFTPKKVWKSIFPQNCSKCGVIIPVGTHYIEVVKDTELIIEDKDDKVFLFKAPRDLILCEECFWEFDFLRGGGKKEFKREFGKLFKEIP